MAQGKEQNEPKEEQKLVKYLPKTLRNHPFIKDARSGKRVTSWWGALLIILASVYVVQSVSIAALNIIFPSPDGSTLKQIQEGIGTTLAIVFVFTWVALRERRHIKTLGFRRPGRGVLLLLIGIVVGIAMNTIPILYLWATGQYEQVDGGAGSASGLAIIPLLLLLLVTVIAQSSNEEILIRGFALQSWGQKMPAWLPIFGLSLLFSLLHGVLADPIPLLMIFFYAVFATFVVLWQKSLWLICGIHAGWNFTMGNIFGIHVSGLPAHTNSLMFLAPTDGSADWLTGGAFGTEGGVPAALTVLVFAGIAYLLYRRTLRTAASSDAFKTGATQSA